jgi:hypothetical protein
MSEAPQHSARTKADAGNPDEDRAYPLRVAEHHRTEDHPEDADE